MERVEILNFSNLSVVFHAMCRFVKASGSLNQEISVTIQLIVILNRGLQLKIPIIGEI